MAHRTRSRTRSGRYGCFQSAPDPAVTCSRTTAKIQRLHPSLAERFGLTGWPPARGSNKAGFGQAIKMLLSELDCPPITKQGSRDSWFRDVANLHYRAKRSGHHTKDKQRLVVSVVAYDSLPGAPLAFPALFFLVRARSPISKNPRKI